MSYHPRFTVGLASLVVLPDIATRPYNLSHTIFLSQMTFGAVDDFKQLTRGRWLRRWCNEHAVEGTRFRHGGLPRAQLDSHSRLCQPLVAVLYARECYRRLCTRLETRHAISHDQYSGSHIMNGGSYLTIVEVQ